MSQGDHFMDKMDVDLNVLTATMIDRVGHHVDGANIAAVDNRHSSNQDVKFLKKLAKLTALGDNIGHNAILRLGIGAGDIAGVWRTRTLGCRQERRNSLTWSV